MTGFFFDNDSCDPFRAARDVEFDGRGKISCVTDKVRKVVCETQCPYCGNALLHMGWFCDSGAQAYDEIDCESWVCERCGFWHHRHYVDANGIEAEERFVSRIKTFDIANKCVPYSRILDWIKAHPEDAFGMHPRNLELIVRDILREHFECELSLTSETRDGGTDLIGYDMERGRFLVEVKRYAKARKVGVAFVRALAGVLTRENVCHGIIVSTSGFSKNATAEAATLKETTQLLPLSIELKTLSELLRWLEVRDSRRDWTLKEKYWESIVSPLVGDAFVTWRR